MEHEPDRALLRCLANALLSWIYEDLSSCTRNKMHQGGRSHENMAEICVRKPEKQIFKKLSLYIHICQRMSCVCNHNFDVLPH